MQVEQGRQKGVREKAVAHQVNSVCNEGPREKAIAHQVDSACNEGPEGQLHSE